MGKDLQIDPLQKLVPVTHRGLGRGSGGAWRASCSRGRAMTRDRGGEPWTLSLSPLSPCVGDSARRHPLMHVMRGCVRVLETSPEPFISRRSVFPGNDASILCGQQLSS